MTSTCKKCGRNSLVPARNYGRPMKDGQLWCPECGHLQMPEPIPDAVKFTMQAYARDIRVALGTFRRALTFKAKQEAKAGLIMTARLRVEGAENVVYMQVRNAAHYAFTHGLAERG